MLTWLGERLRCPDCHVGGLHESDAQLTCVHCGTEFPISHGRPALMRSDNVVFPRSAYRDAPSHAAAPPRAILARLAPARSVNMSRRRELRAFAAKLERAGATSVLVIGAGAQKSWLAKIFDEYPRTRLLYSDVDVSGSVDLFCDAHEIPFLDETFDGVVACAVLEHVLYPERVVAELHRVLTNGGLIYSEIPFLQQVHEGAYDFTRYTLSGHRRLLNRFEEVASGVVAGPATTLAWALEHFALCFSPRVLASSVRLAVRTFFFWLKYLDHLFGQSPAAADGASCTFFLGTKVPSARPDDEIVARYVGMKTLRHV